ncbi:Pentatricopeptide repeat-containing protein [Striga hermonthica]|uniref:Pentatricopeptide repeat-containing protein n=1 Tax=Striga hermonthica TaxID=68872 RepID=A0A9N7P4W8_STRHE|nr:Pentatricopeptide repeat-containing protein [Striga hermonthica]
MTVVGFVGNGTTLVQVVAARGRSNKLKEGKSVQGHFVKQFSQFNLLISTGLVDMYSKCSRVDVARLIFDKMPTMNTISWNAMILGHCIHGNPDDGLSLYKQMVDTKLVGHKNEVEPDEVTFIGVLCACARLGMLTEGKFYFSQMIDVFRLKPNFSHYWCMANLMARVGLLHDAMNVLMNIPTDGDDVEREYSLWATLHGSCRFLGDVTSSEKIVTAFIERDPQNLYYNLLVNIYALAGKWEEVARTNLAVISRT